MRQVLVDLTQEQFKKLDKLFPKIQTMIGKRAIEIVKLYFKKKYPQCTFLYPRDGSDLGITWSGRIEKIEIKGTASHDIAFQRLKVSSIASYTLLKNGLPLYRVTSVFERSPTIFILHYPKDFEMIEEPRWRVQKRKNQVDL